MKNSLLDENLTLTIEEPQLRVPNGLLIKFRLL